MLALSRRLGQRILIGGNITVTILSVKGRNVELGIEAPRAIDLDRNELIERQKRLYLSDLKKRII